MPLYLYNIWLQEPATARSRDQIQAQVQSAGLLEEGGTVAERIAAQEIDLTVDGQFRLGEILAPKHADELESLGKSAYEHIPLYAEGDMSPHRDRGYYEVVNVDTNPAQPTTEATFEYTAALRDSGSQETHWRAVRTNLESISHGLSSGTDTRTGVDATAVKARWFDFASGTESATVQSTVNAEFGDVDLYDPTEPSFSDPMLIYEVAKDREWRTDVRVWDDVGESSRTWSVTDADGNTASATQWRHVYHVGAEFDGEPIVSNGLLRLQFDDANDQLDAEQWNDGTSSWDNVAVSHTDYSLLDADIISILPADVRIYAEWEDTGDASIHPVILSVQRGESEAYMRIPENESSIPSDLETQLDPVVNARGQDSNPAQTLVRRSEVSGE